MPRYTLVKEQDGSYSVARPNGSIYISHESFAVCDQFIDLVNRNHFRVDGWKSEIEELIDSEEAAK